MAGHILDLEQNHFVKQRGDITVYGTWVGENLSESEPCLVLVPTYRMGTKPCCVALSSAYKYDDPIYLANASRRFNEALGFEDSSTRVVKVASAIVEHLGDLIAMPPKPKSESKYVAEATLTDDSGRSRSFEIIEDV